LLLWVHQMYPKKYGTIAEAAARYGYFDLLKKMKEYLPICDSRVLVKAAKGGHFEMLKWAREEVVTFGLHSKVEQACHKAISKGHFEIAKWLLRGYRSNEVCRSALNSAASKGHLDMVQWLLELGPKKAGV